MRSGLIALCLLLAAAPALRAQHAAADSVAWARVAYLTASTAYLDAGRDAGLREQSVAEVVRGGRAIARIRIEFLSSGRASGSIEAVEGEPVVGDSVRFAPVRSGAAGPAAAAARVVPPAPGDGAARRHAGRLRGRLGVRYLAVDDRSGLGGGLSQPAFDARLTGSGLAGTPMGVVADVRARRTTATRAGGSAASDGRYRVYRLALLWERAGSPVRLTLGRQHSAGFAPAGFFDGLTAEYVRAGWGAGVFGGLQPDPVTFGFSAAVRQGGAYVQLHQRPGSERRWTVTAGGVGAYTRGEVDREFAFLQGSYSGRRVSLYGSQEIDYNRGWKREAGEPAVSATSTLLAGTVRATDGIALRAGFDNRRNVRLFRAIETPETEFDDAYRQGWWGGVSAGSGRLRFGADVRASRGGAAGPAESWTLSAAAARLAGAADVRLRTTRYTSEHGDGWLHAASVAAAPSGALRLEASGGLRSRTDPRDDPAVSETGWVTLDADLAIARAWYLLLSVTRESGAEATDQVYGGISWRF